MGLKLRQEVGVGQLGVDDELEVTVVFTLLSSQLNVPGEGGGSEVNTQKQVPSSAAASGFICQLNHRQFTLGQKGNSSKLSPRQPIFISSCISIKLALA